MSESNNVLINTKEVKAPINKENVSLNNISEKSVSTNDTKTYKKNQFEEKIKNINNLLDQYDEIEWLTGC